MTLNDLKKDIILAPYTSWGIGGPADYLFEARSDEELISAVAFARKEKMPFIVLGGGTNVLVSDNGFRGLIIVARNKDYDIKDENISAGAGIAMGVLMNASLENGLGGLEWAAGLPGTLGGAIYGNAGTFGHSISEFIEEVKIIEPDGKIKDYSSQECDFGYRSSKFQQMPGVVIVSAKLKLIKGDIEKTREEIKKNVQWRAQHHPAYKSCGCVFRNAVLTPEARLPQDEDKPVQWFDTVPSGWLIDKAGLKGMRKGGFTVSQVHCNFLVNDGTGTAAQLEELIAQIKKEIKDKFNLELKEEVRRIGS